MASILTNVSAMTALQTLSRTTTSLYETQNRISTGLRINSASDNAGYWAIAATMRSDVAGFNAITDALGLGLGMVGTAIEANDKLIELFDDIKEQVVNALNPVGDKAKYNDAVQQLKANVQTIINSASFSGGNLLDGSINDVGGAGGPLQVLASLVRSGATVTPEYITFDPATSHYSDNAGAAGLLLQTQGGGAAAMVANGILHADFTFDNTTVQADLEDALAEVEAVIALTQTIGTSLGALEMRMQNQQNFMTSLIDSTERGIGVLVDADMNEESSRLKALQVQQQLGIESLNIANAEPQNILALFR